MNNEDQMIPDPKCTTCKGTGRIVLFSSSSNCDCLRPHKQDRLIDIYVSPDLIDEMKGWDMNTCLTCQCTLNTTECFGCWGKTCQKCGVGGYCAICQTNL